MARKRERAFAWFFAVIFIVSSSALTIAIIVQAATSKKPASETSQEAKVDSTKLEGTPLSNFQAPVTIDKLQVFDTSVGTGKEVKAGDTVSVDYTGALASNGIIFQSSKDTGAPVTLSLKQVIAGWSQGIPGMKEGGSRRLYIPASLAYGSQAQSGIPANSDLVFDVTVHKVE